MHWKAEQVVAISPLTVLVSWCEVMATVINQPVSIIIAVEGTPEQCLKKQLQEEEVLHPKAVGKTAQMCHIGSMLLPIM